MAHIMQRVELGQ